jgi:predicted metal-dependent enzyme (double-stranded beta helix superfamily)
LNQQTKGDNSAKTWPEGLDAMTAAAGNHRILFENERVRVLNTNIAPGETVPLHTHRWPSVMYVMSFSDFIRYDEQGRVLLDSSTLSSKPQPGEVMWSSPLEPHTLKNTCSTDLHVVSVELKD